MIRDTAATDRVIESGRKPRRIILLVLGGLFAVILVAYAWSAIDQWAGAARSVSADSLRFATVERGMLQRDLTASGRIVAAVRPTVFAPAAGTVFIRVRAGDEVDAGQLLATLDSPEMESRLDQERATLESLQVAVERERIELRKQMLAYRKAEDMARVALEAAEREMQRSEESHARDLISDIDYQKARDDLNRAKLEYAHAQADRELARESLDFELDTRQLELRRQKSLVADLERQVGELEVRSPVAGIVGNLDVDNRQAVIRNQTLMSVVDLSALEVELDVPESYADELAFGTPAEVRIGNAEHAGQVTSVSPEIRDGQVSARVRFENAIPEGLRQNQRVTARLLFDRREDVLKVQRGPFVDSGGGRVAYVREGDTLVRRTIRTAPGSLSEVQVIDGLEPGDVIVISGLERLGEAERVLLN